MQLYFVRHALAEDASPGGSDARRELTAKGVARTKQTARLLAALALTVDRLYSSPYTRARHTAELIAPALDAAVQVRQELAPGFSTAAVEALIADLGADDAIMFVGHEPDLSAVVSALSGGSSIEMKKGSIARLDTLSFRPLRCQLVWLLPPRLFDTYNDPPPPGKPKKPKNKRPVPLDPDDIPF